jgi:hypothetical protein
VQRVEDLAAEHVAAFNDAVASGDFAAFLERFADDAVMRFENVPGAGVLEFPGRAAYAAAYARQPPDDQISIAGPVHDRDGTIVIPFVWRRDGTAGAMRLTLRDGRISRLVVAFA